MLYIENNCTLIHLFLTRGVGTSKTFTSKFIIQGSLWLCDKDILYDLTKTKALPMALMGKVAFNIDGLIIHSVLNIPNNPYLIYQTYHHIH